jgi:hypothetical protein
MSIVQLTAAVDNVPALVAAPDAKLDGLALVFSDGAVGVDMPQALTSTAAVAISKVRVRVISAAPIRKENRRAKTASRTGCCRAATLPRR